MKLEYLADNEEAIPQLASWYFQEWGRFVEGTTLDKEEQKLQQYLNRDRMPLIVVAKEGSQVVGAAQLKFREMPQFPEKEHWLGGVYVAQEHRGRNLATLMIDKIVRHAERLGVPELYLQTEHLDGGLYARLGWRALEQVRGHDTEVLIMVRDLGKP